MAPVRNMEYVLTSPDWREMDSATKTNRQFLPNRIRQNLSTREAAIILKVSNTGGFALGCNPLHHYIEAVRSTRCSQCWVIFTDEAGRYIDANTIKNVELIIRAEQPNPTTGTEGWSDYWWLNQDWTISRPGRPGGSSAESSMLPF